MKHFIIAGNWKMNAPDVPSFAGALKKGETPGVTRVICTPFPYLASAAAAFRAAGVSVGAQDVSERENGAFTGDVSAAMLVSLGVKYVIIGHSERRQYHAETDALVLEKTRAALRAGLSPVICVGENLTEREAGHAPEVVSRQTRSLTDNLSAEEISKIVVAYEPIWAIGTGKTASPGEAEEMCALIKSLAGVPVLYGGSMTADNADELLAQTSIDGGLIGGASLDPVKFQKIADIAAGRTGA